MVLKARLPITMHNNQPLIDGSLNGQPVRWLMDTGADTSMISGPAAARAGLRLRMLSNYELRGVGGVIYPYTAHIDRLGLGGIELHDLRMLVAADHDTSHRDISHRVDVAGLIGEQVFGAFDIEIDLAHGKVNFFQTRDCAKTDSLAYWDGPVSVVPMRRYSDLIHIPVTINGVEMIGLLDTGASLSGLSRDAADDLGLHPGDAGVREAGDVRGIGSRSVKAYIAAIDNFVIGDESISHTRLRIIDEGSLMRGAQLLLGADFLRAHRVLVAHSQRRVYISYTGGPVFEVMGATAPTASGAPAGAAASGDAQPAPASSSPR